MTAVIRDQRDVAQTLADTVNLLDVEAIAGLGLEQALAIQVALDDVNRTLAVVRGAIPDVLAPAWGEKQVEVPGVGVFELHVKKNRTKWDREALLRDVKDARVLDEATGEIVGHLDKVLRVWNLGAPRVTALRAMGLTADEYCTTERAGFQIEKVG